MSRNDIVSEIFADVLEDETKNAANYDGIPLG